MSKLNGDKARFNRIRKQRAVRRLKIRNLQKEIFKTQPPAVTIVTKAVENLTAPKPKVRAPRKTSTK